jgi:hypothetical protein
MSYVSNQLSKVYDELESGITYWVYYTSDSLGAVQASGYVSDATSKRLKLGDVVDVFSGTLTNFAASSGGASLGAASFAPTVGITARFSAVPTWARMQVSAVTAGTTTTAGAATLAEIDLPIAALGVNPRNLIDAGDAGTAPWQLGTGVLSGGSTAKLTADRFCAIGGAGSSWTVQKTADTNVQGFSNSFAWGRSSTDTHTTGLTFGQVFETADSVRAQGLPLSMSQWVRAGSSFAAGASAGVYIMQLIAGTGTDDTFANLASGSWTGASTVATATITPGTAASRVGPFAGVVPTNATQLGWLVSYQPSAGTTAGTTEQLFMNGIQVEVGGMSPFEHLDIAEVFNIATRYLQVIPEPTAGIAVGPAAFSASSIAQVHIPFPAVMRKAPTLTFTAGGYCITDSALGAHTISSGGLSGANSQAATLTVTCAATLTAGLVSFMQGRTTGSGTIILDSDYA